MNRDLETLAAWATEKAEDDPDQAARPLWAQIAVEVDMYLNGEESSEPQHQALFEGTD